MFYDTQNTVYHNIQFTSVILKKTTTKKPHWTILFCMSTKINSFELKQGGKKKKE